MPLEKGRRDGAWPAHDCGRGGVSPHAPRGEMDSGAFRDIHAFPAYAAPQIPGIKLSQPIVRTILPVWIPAVMSVLTPSTVILTVLPFGALTTAPRASCSFVR